MSVFFFKVKAYAARFIKNCCSLFRSLLAFFLNKKVFFSCVFVVSLGTFFYLFNEELLKFLLGDIDVVQSFSQNLTGFDSSKNINGEELTEQEKHLRKVNAKLDHQVKQAEEARHFAEERAKNPELEKFIKEHAFALNVLTFVFCFMVIINIASHLPPPSSSK